MQAPIPRNEFAALGATEMSLGAGRSFDLARPETGQVAIGDIALALSHLCRFAGRTERFYSVAEHSVHCSYLVPPRDAFAALMHDAHEAVIGDVIAPVKRLCPDLCQLEDSVQRAVLRPLGLSLPLPEPVRRADLAMLAAEKVQALGCLAHWPVLDGIRPAAVRLQFWPPRTARRAFLSRFAALRPRPA